MNISVLIISMVIPLLSFIAYCGLLVIILRRRLQRVHKTFAVYVATLALWGLVTFFIYSGFFPGHTLLLYQLLAIVLLVLIASYYHFLRAFLNKPAGIGVKLAYGIAAVAIPLSLTGYLIESAYISEGLPVISIGLLAYPLALVGMSLLCSAIFSLIRQYRHLKDALARSRSAYIFIGFAVVVAFFMTNFIGPLSKYPVANFGNIVNAFLITYAIQRYQLLDIRLVSRRGLVYGILAIIVIAIYIGLANLIGMYAQVLPVYTVILATTLTGFLVAVFFRPVTRKTQELVDRRFFGKTYDYRQFLLSYSDKMSNILNIDELAENMLDPITKALHTREASLLLPDTESGDFTTRFAHRADDEKPAADPHLRKDNPILTWLAKEGKPLNIDSIDTIP